MRASAVLIVSCVTAAAARPACAGAWLLPPGEGQAILTTTFADARKAYDANGRLIETPSYRKFETRVYVEYGVLDWLTVVAEGGYMNFSGAAGTYDRLNLLIDEAKAGLPLSLQSPPGASYEGLGLGALGARTLLFTWGDYIVSAQAGVRAASPAARRFLDMRDAVQGDLRLLVGRPFELFGLAGFIDAQLGYRSRGQNGDEIRADFTLGLRPLPPILLLAQSYSGFAPRGGPAGVVAAQKFQLSAVYDVSASLSLQIGAIAAIGGVNSPAERGLISALWWRY
ncbi:MAG: hypothetical protein FJX45_13455 [Alphaproteobacteria bacterium]|nr:hypothetical protein [Alphaproteobacteria bacterium]MBM3651940.1 hypothetical protein [Alphaproteobacteria bacterium]